MDSETYCPDCGGKMPSDSCDPICLACVLGGTVRYFGDYELRGELGRGAMGVVYRARQISLDRLVAVKTMRTEGPQGSHPDSARRFQNEAEAAASLDHPNIVPVYEVGTHDGFHFLSMKLVHGTTLSAWVGARSSSHGRTHPAPSDSANGLPIKRVSWTQPPPEKLATIVQKVARAVHYAHQRGVLHRDLKPDNVLIDAQGEPHVTDFGLAKFIDKKTMDTHSGVLLGTPAFMAPEQTFGSRHTTTASDLYSLGAILYFALSGCPPFSGQSVAVVLEKLRKEDPVRPTKLNLDANPTLETICLKCLRKDPSARYSSAEALAEDLGRFLRHEPIEAKRISSLQRLQLWCVRQPITVALIATLLITSITSVGWIWQRVQADNSLRRLGFSSILHADDLLRFKESSEGLHQLSMQLRRDPGNQIAAARLMSALTWRSWPIPTAIYGPHSGNAIFANVTTGGDRMVTADSVGMIRVWETRRGTELFSHKSRGDLFGFNPPTGLVLTLSHDGSFDLLRTQDGTVTSSRFSSNTLNVALSPVESQAAVLGLDRVELWGLEPSRRLRTLIAPSYVPHNRPGNTKAPINYSPDGQKLVAVFGSWAAVWDAQGGQRIGVISNIQDHLEQAEFNLDGTAVLLRSKNWVGMFRVDTGSNLWHRPFLAGVEKLAWSPDADRIALNPAPGSGKPCVLLEGATGRELIQFPQGYVFPGETPISSDGNAILLTKEPNPILSVFSTSQLLPHTESTFLAKAIVDATFLNQSRQAIACDGSAFAIQYDFSSSRAKPFRMGEGQTVVDYRISPAKGWVLLLTADGKAQLCSGSSGKPLGPPVGGPEALTGIALSPDGSYAATASEDGALHLWNPADATLIAKTDQPLKGTRRIAFAPNGKVLAVLSSSLSLRVFELPHCTQLAETVIGATKERKHRIDVCVFDPGGTRILVASDLGIHVVDILRSQILWHKEGAAWDAEFSPDGKRVAAAKSMLNEVSIYDAASGRELVGPLPHPGFTMGVAFHPHEDLLITTCADPVIRLWDARDGTLLRRLTGHSDGIRDVHFSSDGLKMASASLDNTIRLWDVETWLPISDFMSGHGGSNISQAEFVDADHHLLGFSHMSKGLSLWPADLPPKNPPLWVLDLANLLADGAQNNAVTNSSANVEKVLKIRQQTLLHTGDDFYSRWGRWFFGERATRSPFPE